jgi:hypothetical protein
MTLPPELIRWVLAHKGNARMTDNELVVQVEAALGNKVVRPYPSYYMAQDQQVRDWIKEIVTRIKARLSPKVIQAEPAALQPATEQEVPAAETTEAAPVVEESRHVPEVEYHVLPAVRTRDPYPVGPIGMGMKRQDL